MTFFKYNVFIKITAIYSSQKLHRSQRHQFYYDVQEVLYSDNGLIVYICVIKCQFTNKMWYKQAIVTNIVVVK